MLFSNIVGKKEYWHFSTVNTSCKVFQGAVNTILCPIKRGRICTIATYNNYSSTAGWCSAFVQPCGQQHTLIWTPRVHRRHVRQSRSGYSAINDAAAISSEGNWDREYTSHRCWTQRWCDLESCTTDCSVLWTRFCGSYGSKIRANFRPMYQAYTGESMSYQPLHKYMFYCL